jgi:methionine biosynthesis protein MetW
MKTVDSIYRGFLSAPPAPDRYGHGFDPNGASGFICGMVAKKSRVLDVGCGDGSLAGMLRDRLGADVFGIEPEQIRADVARGRGIPVHGGYLDADFALEHGLFDVVLFADVLEHVPDPFSLLLHGISCLAPGGSIIVSVPNIAHWSVRLRVLTGRFDYEPYGIMDATHLRWFTKTSIVAFLHRAGLQPVDIRSTAGTSLDVYRQAPWKWLPSGVTWHLAVTMARNWPALFGCQTVIRSELAPIQVNRSA